MGPLRNTKATNHEHQDLSPQAATISQSIIAQSSNMACPIIGNDKVEVAVNVRIASGKK